MDIKDLKEFKDELKDMKLPKLEKKKGVNPLVVAAAGIAVGVGAAAAVRTLQKNKKARTQVKKIIDDVRDQATNYASNLKKSNKVEKATKAKSKTTKRTGSKKKS